MDTIGTYHLKNESTNWLGEERFATYREAIDAAKDYAAQTADSYLVLHAEALVSPPKPSDCIVIHLGATNTHGYF